MKTKKARQCLCLECYRWLPHPLLSFLVSYFRHFSSLDSVVTQTHEGFLQGTNRFHLTSTPLVTMHNGTRAVGPGPGGTPSRGRTQSLQLASEAQLHVSARRLAEEAGIAGRSRRSRCRRCSLRTWRRGRRRRRGSRRCREAPAGAPPEGNAK